MAEISIITNVLKIILTNWIISFIKKDKNAVRRAIEKIHKAYTKKSRETSQRETISYTSAVYQFAYEYLYLLSHINMIKRLLTSFWASIKNDIRRWIMDINKRRVMNVCCIGGGPGSELFGLISFLKTKSVVDETVRVEATVLDRFPEWKKTANEFNEEFKKNNSFAPSEISYVMFDFFKLDRNSLYRISQADVVTLVKFISAVSANRCECSENLKEILKNVKSGALVLFAENITGDDDELFEAEAVRTGFTRLKTIKKTYSIFKREEHKMLELAKRLRIKHHPQSSVSITASIWKKK